MRLRRTIPRLAGLLLAAAVFAVVVVLACHFNGALWITDGGNKKIVLRNMAENHGATAIANPASELDPENRFFPTGGFHFQKLGGKIHSFYPVFFPALNRPVYALWGNGGLFLLPLLGGLTAALLLFFLARRLPVGRAGRILLPPLLLAATPLFFYTLTFWEMSLACALGAAAMLAGIAAEETQNPRLWFLTGCLLAAGLFLREEFFLLCAVFGGYALLRHGREPKLWGALATGGGIAASLYFLAQFLLSGNPLGLHTVQYFQNGGHTAFFARLAENYSVFLLRFDTRGTPAWEIGIHVFFAAAAVAGLLARDFRALRRWKAAFLGIACVLWTVLAVRLLRAGEPIAATLFQIGLIPGNPIFFFAVLNSRALWNVPSEKLRLLTRVTLSATMFLPLLLSCADMGILWGARHFIPLFPGLLLCSFYAAKKSNLFLPFLLTAAFSLIFQIHSIRLLSDMETARAKLDIILRQNSGDVIVCDVFFLPEMTPERFFDRRILAPAKAGDLPEIGEILERKNIGECTLVLSANPAMRRVSDAELAAFLSRRKIQAAAKHTFPGASFLNLVTVRCVRQ